MSHQMKVPTKTTLIRVKFKQYDHNSRSFKNQSQILKLKK